MTSRALITSLQKTPIVIVEVDQHDIPLMLTEQP
jgi:hypothetical protein